MSISYTCEHCDVHLQMDAVIEGMKCPVCREPMSSDSSDSSDTGRIYGRSDCAQRDNRSARASADEQNMSPNALPGIKVARPSSRGSTQRPGTGEIRAAKTPFRSTTSATPVQAREVKATRIDAPTSSSAMSPPVDTDAMVENARIQANQILSEARQQAEQVSRKAQQQAEQLFHEAQQQIAQQRNDLLAQAQQHAAQIVEEAQQRACSLVEQRRAEVEDELQRQIDYIHAEVEQNAREEAQQLTEQARQRAAKIIAEAELISEQAVQFAAAERNAIPAKPEPDAPAPASVETAADDQAAAAGNADVAEKPRPIMLGSKVPMGKLPRPKVKLTQMPSTAPDELDSTPPTAEEEESAELAKTPPAETPAQSAAAPLPIAPTQLMTADIEPAAADDNVAITDDNSCDTKASAPKTVSKANQLAMVRQRAVLSRVASNRSAAGKSRPASAAPVTAEGKKSLIGRLFVKTKDQDQQDEEESGDSNASGS